MKRKIGGFTLIELLVVIAIIALLISILLPSLSRARELSKRLVCASNIKGVGTSAKIYANDNSEQWMIPAFKRTLIDNQNVLYTRDRTDQGYPGQVGHERVFQGLSDTPTATNAGSTAVSVTRAFWMLVRSGDVTVKQFICPSSGDQDDPTEDIDFYYDFVNIDSISYGYQVPFGPRDTQPREGMDNRQAMAADKGPWYLQSSQPEWVNAEDGRIITKNDSPKNWRPYNSQNHGGQGNGEGQNVLFADGHATFARTPIVGIDQDNIYTLMDDTWDLPGFNLIHGLSPTERDPNPYPGEGAFGTGAGKHSSTDSLIYP